MSESVHNSNPVMGAIYLTTSFAMGFFGWIGWTSMQEWLKFVSLLISMGAGVMAIRYYWFATKKTRNDKQ